MIGVVATLKVKPDQIENFEAAMGELVRATNANEPGVKSYQLAKSRKDANTYVVLELYEDQAALDAHMKSAHFVAAGPKLGACLADCPSMELYDTVGG